MTSLLCHGGRGCASWLSSEIRGVSSRSFEGYWIKGTDSAAERGGKRKRYSHSKIKTPWRHQHTNLAPSLSHFDTASEQYCHELKLQLSQSTKLVEELQKRLSATEAELQTAKEQLQHYEDVKVVSSQSSPEIFNSVIVPLVVWLCLKSLQY